MWRSVLRGVSLCTAGVWVLRTGVSRAGVSVCQAVLCSHCEKGVLAPHLVVVGGALGILLIFM